MAEQKIIIEIEGKGQEVVKSTAEAFSYLKTVVKEADYEFRKKNISSEELAKRLKSVDEQAKQLNLTYKQQTDINAQLYQVQQRALVGFRSLAVDMAQLKNGAGGVSNAIMGLTQSMLTMRATSGSVGLAFSTMLSQLTGPMGILLAVSMIAALVSAFKDDLFPAAEDSAKSLKKITDELEKQKKLAEEIIRKRYETGDISRAKYLRLLQAELTVLQLQLEALLLIGRAKTDPGFRGITAPTKGGLKTPGFTVATAVSTGVSVAVDKDKMLGQRSAAMELESKILDVTKAINALTKEGLQEQEELADKLYRRRKALFDLDERQRELEEKGERGRQERIEHIAKMKDDAEKRQLKKTEQNLRSAMNAYNSLFFDPLKSAFDSAASGSGNMAEAFSQAIDQMIKKLIAMAAYSWILSLLFPGAGGFGSIFTNMAGLNVLPTETTGSDSSYSPTDIGLNSRSFMTPIVVPVTIGGDEIGAVLVDALGQAVYRRNL